MRLIEFERKRRNFRFAVFIVGIVLGATILLEEPKVSEAALQTSSMIRFENHEQMMILERLVKEIATYPEMLAELPKDTRKDLKEAVRLLESGDRQSLERKLFELSRTHLTLSQLLN